MTAYDLPTVLLVEDSRDDEMLSLRAMRRCGLPLLVRVARDGTSAMRALGLDGPALKNLPDLVLCDLQLPVVNGDEVLRRARLDERLVGIPFILFSSSDLPDDYDRCMRFGASEFITKPVAYESYIACVKSLMLRWMGDWHAASKSQRGETPMRLGSLR